MATARRRCCRWSRPGRSSRPRGTSLPARVNFLLSSVHLDVAAAGHAAGAHAAGHHGGVRGHAAADGQDALGGLHALDVLGRGLQADEDDLLAPLMPLLGVLGGEHDRPQAAPGEAARPLPMTWAFFRASASKVGCSSVSSCLGSTRHTASFSSIMPSSTRSHGHLQSGGGGALAVAGLQHIELAILDGELHVLHVVVVLLKAVGRSSANCSYTRASPHAAWRWATGCGRRPRRPRPGR